MNVTNNLKLPQYTEEDIFDLQDINKAYSNIDNAYKEVIDFKNEIPKTNATAEVINARGGKETLGKRLDEFGSQLDNIKYDCISEIVNVLDFGAYLNGKDDDSEAFNKALRVGNVKVPSGSKVRLNKTVYINNPQRYIDFSESVVTIGANTTGIQIANKDITIDMLNIQIKNAFVVCTEENSSFAKSYNSYFVTFDNIRIAGLNGTGFGIHIANGFNVKFNEVHIGGMNSGIDNIAGNNANGIIIETLNDVPTQMINKSNITNINIDSCLIQRVKNGIYFLNTAGTTYDTNKINNVGFSNCDVCINADVKEIRNLQVSLLRCEDCGTMIVNDGQVTLQDVYCYRTKYCMDNKVNGYLIYSGMLYHWNPINENGQAYFIKNNDGVISLSAVTYYERTRDTVYKNEGNIGRIIQRQNPYSTVTRVNKNQTLHIDSFTVEYIDQQAFLNFDNITGDNGAEFYIFSSNNSSFQLPNGTYVVNTVLEKTMLHCKIINGEIIILGQKTPVLSQSTNTTVAGTNKQSINIIDCTVSLTKFNFNEIGLTIIYSSIDGVTLSNGNGNILNFGELNSNNAVNLKNNPLLMIPCGNGKGLAIKC